MAKKYKGKALANQYGATVGANEGANFTARKVTDVKAYSTPMTQATEYGAAFDKGHFDKQYGYLPKYR